jgi:hypothetical protein
MQATPATTHEALVASFVHVPLKDWIVESDSRGVRGWCPWCWKDTSQVAVEMTKGDGRRSRTLYCVECSKHIVFDAPVDAP